MVTKMEKRKIALITIVVFVVGLIITGSSYAFWSWSSNVNKNVVFNVASNLKNYIVYNEGESAFTGELNVSNNYQTNSIHSTISIYKTTNVSLLATIHMDINQIGPNMKQSRALKWVVTEGTTSNVGSVLAKGNFVGTNNGDVLTLVPDINVTTTEAFYTIWIWLDSSENPSSNLAGETLDTNVWTEINQAEGSEDRYEITNSNVNYQQISATVVDSKAKVTKYAITQSSTEPSSWTTITPATDQANVYTLNTSVNSTGTYYVWFKDENDRVTKKQVTVSSIDTTAPSCNWGAFTPSTIQNNETSSVTLTCTDSESGISVHNLTTSDFTPQNNRITVTNVEKSAVTNGYQYMITVTGTTNDGTSYITLAADKVRNGTNIGNASTSSSDITVQNPYANITGGETKIFNYSDTTLTCSYFPGYETGYTGHYEFGYSSTENGEITWLGDSTSTTLTVSKSEFVGTRYYFCRTYGTDGTTTTDTLTSEAPTTMTLNRVAITFDATTNGGTPSTSSPLYVGYEGDELYTSITNDTIVDPNATKTNYSLSGWYTAAGGGTMVIDDNGIIQPSVTNYTNQDGKFIITSSTTLYAQYREGYYENVDTGATYTSLNAAFSAVAADETIKVLTSSTADDNVTNSQTGIKLDLNGKTLTMSTTLVNRYIINNGELDIYNSSPKTAILTGKNTNSTQGIIYNNGTLTTNKTSSTNNIIIQNTGTSYNCRVIYNLTSKMVTLNTNTTIQFTQANSTTNTGNTYYRSVINTLGTVYIQGATINNAVGTKTVDIGIDISSTTGKVIMSSGSITASGNAIYNRSSTVTTPPAIDVSAGVITSNNGTAIYNYTSGKIRISGGTIKSSYYGISGGSGPIEVSGGYIEGTSYYGILSSSGAVTITGGTIKGNSLGVYKTTATGTITIGINDSDVSTTSPAIYGRGAIETTGTLNYYDGVFYSKNTKYSYYGYTNIPSGYVPITIADEYGYKTYLGEPTYTAIFYYNKNTTSGSTTISTQKSGCIPEEGNVACDVTIPIINSGGTYNNAYAGLADSVGTMTTVVAAANTTISISSNITYYAVYSSQVKIYYPDTTSTVSNDIAYRNQWFTSTSAMATTVLSTTSGGMTSDYIFEHSIAGYNLAGFNGSSGNSTSVQYQTISEIINSTIQNVFTLLYKEVTATVYYYDNGLQTATIAANQYIQCIFVSGQTYSAQIYNSSYSVPTYIKDSVGIGGNVYTGLSNVPNSTTITTTINTSSTAYYAVYGGSFTATFNKENDNVTSIGSTSLSCTGYDTTDGTVYSGTTCSITLPSISAVSGYDVLGWFKNLALIGQPNTSLVLKSNETYTARAGILAARNIHYDNAKTGVGCNDVQCMIDYLDSGSNSNITLAPGNYITYIPTSTSFTTDKAFTGYSSTQTINPSELTTWRVLRLNNDGTIDIISDNVSSVNIYFSGTNGYNNLVGYLNVLASQYESSTYTVGSRHFGYDGQTLSITNNIRTSAFWGCSTGGTCIPDPDDYEAEGGGDTKYLTDYNLLYQALGTRQANKVGTSTATNYWMASRYYSYTSATTYGFRGRYVTSSSSSASIYYCSNSTWFSTSVGYAIRPIVTLKAGLSYSGSGTSGDPWVITSN